MAQHFCVIGAGPAGLAVAARLQARGHRVSLLDRAEAVGGNWRTRYDGFRLNTARWFSHLPGLRMPGRLGWWVGRDDYVAYLERYAAHHQLRLRAGVTVKRVEPGPGGAARWRVDTDAGTLEAAGVVVATGAFDLPVIPPWPGLDSFRGEFCHALDYRSAAAYVNRSVLVVGAGASGLEIATLLTGAGAAAVFLSVRSCQNLFTRQWRAVPLTPVPAAQHLPTPVLDVAGRAIHRLLGADWPDPLPRPAAALGTAMRRDGAEPLVADGAVEALRDGRIRMVPAVTGFGDREVSLADGRTLRPDAVIAATGYTHGLADLVGHLDVLGPDGQPVQPGGGGISQAPGLAFLGFEPAVTGRLLQMARQSRRAVRTVTAGTN